MMCRVPAWLFVGSAILIFSPMAVSEPTKCGPVFECAQVAVNSAARAEAAATAVRRPAVVAHFGTPARDLGVVFRNDTDRTKVVMVSTSRTGAAQTMFANMAVAVNQLPAGPTGGSNGASVSAASFINAAHVSNVTFVVPPGYYYNITCDGPGMGLVLWTEADM